MAACLSAALALIVWGVTFVNTRALLADSSALEILMVRFAMAWAVLCGWEMITVRPEFVPCRNAEPLPCQRLAATV